MGGSSGGIIVTHARIAMTDPLIHGNLPPEMQILVDAVCDKDEWDDNDKDIMARAFGWALKNL